jgi:endonuclease-8
MPEGDTVHKVARNLHVALAGGLLTRTDFRVPSFATADLSGRVMSEVVARGKHILMRVGGGDTIHSHLAMDGEWTLFRPSERWRSPAHWARLVLRTEEWEAVGFRLKICEVIPTAHEAEAVGHLGPDPLGPDWDAEEALRRLTADPSRPIGEVLLDQRIIAGLGNVYRSEICFLRGVDPRALVGEVGIEPVVDLAYRLLQANRETGDQITTGDRRPGRRRWVYERAGRPCRRCGARIESFDDAKGRRTYGCPGCQGIG